MSHNCTAHQQPSSNRRSVDSPPRPPLHISEQSTFQRCSVSNSYTEHEREVEEKEISQTQAKAQKDEGPFQYATSHLHSHSSLTLSQSDCLNEENRTPLLL